MEEELEEVKISYSKYSYIQTIILATIAFFTCIIGIIGGLISISVGSVIVVLTPIVIIIFKLFSHHRHKDSYIIVNKEGIKSHCYEFHSWKYISNIYLFQYDSEDNSRLDVMLKYYFKGSSKYIRIDKLKGSESEIESLVKKYHQNYHDNLDKKNQKIANIINSLQLNIQ